MGRTFEALTRAQKEHRITDREALVFERKVDETPRVPLKLRLSSLETEEYHRMKQNIVSALPDRQSRVVLFASPTQGEGASTIAVRFARLLASTGERVLLVDADMRDPSLHDVFGVPLMPGLAELLAGRVDLDDVIRPTNVLNLWVIPSGGVVANPATLFEQGSVVSELEDLRKRFAWILCDSACVNGFNDAVAIGPKLDGTIMVVEAERTKREAALFAKRKLEDAGISLIGAVLNRRRMRIPEWLYRRL
jgi:capsular exopolysaccharide synthesis family protein